ncbi:MAG TPA: ribosomal L7Ae/L30e/S12e/Gadd45 family protein [Bacilli bacterium]
MDRNARSYLGLALRAGMLKSGDDTVYDAIKNGSAKLVIIASDASANALKKAMDKCRHYRIPLAEGGTRQELGACLGKAERVIVAITDSGFANLIGKRLNFLTEVDHIE